MEAEPETLALPVQGVRQQHAATRAEIVTFGLLFVGYIFYYLTRKNISVAQVSMEQLGLLTQAQVGYLASAGTMAYAVGKFVNGVVTDRIGGKRVFVLGMAGSVAATVMFALSGRFETFLFWWIVNSYFLSMGWGGLIRVMSYWFDRGHRGLMVGLMTVNFQIGSTLAKLFTAFLSGFSLLVWRGLFLVPAGLLAGMFVVTLLWLRETPPGHRSFREEFEKTRHRSMNAATFAVALWHALASPTFLLVLWGSVLFTFLRTFFDDFATLWMAASDHGTSVSGYIAATFTMGGIAGTLVAGWLSDRSGNRGPFLIMSGCCLSALLFASPLFSKASTSASVLFFLLVGFFLFGAYSIIAGVSAIDFGRHVAPATAAGIIDGVGYAAAAGAGLLIGHLRAEADWERLVFRFAWITLGMTLLLLPLWWKYPRQGAHRP